MSAAPQTQSLGELAVRVGALEERFEDLEPRLRVVERHVPTPEEKRDLELRVRALESVRWKYAGALAVLVLVATFAGSLLAKRLGG